MAAGRILCFGLALGSFLIMTASAQDSNAMGCVSSCENLPDGNYPSCYSCTSYCACRLGNLIDFIPCPPRYFWDKALGRCRYGSCKFRTPGKPHCFETETVSLSQEICDSTVTSTVTTTNTFTSEGYTTTMTPTTWNLGREVTITTDVTQTSLSSEFTSVVMASTSVIIDLVVSTEMARAPPISEYTTTTSISVFPDNRAKDRVVVPYTTTRTAFTCVADPTNYPDEYIVQTATITPTEYVPVQRTTVSNIRIVSTLTSLITTSTTVIVGRDVTAYTTTSTECSVQPVPTTTQTEITALSSTTPINTRTIQIDDTIQVVRRTTSTPVSLSISTVVTDAPPVFVTTTPVTSIDDEITITTTSVDPANPVHFTATFTNIRSTDEFITASDIFCSTSRVDTTITNTVLETERLDILTVTCTGKLLVFFDGILQIAPASELNSVDQVSTFEIPRDTIIVALECCRDESLPGNPGIIASIDSGDLVTDDSWWCSPIHRTGWSMPNFAMDSSYRRAAVNSRPGVPEVHSTAEWIWATRARGRTPWGNSFCRKVLRI